MGFRRCVLPGGNLPLVDSVDNVEILEVKSVSELSELIFES
jgi:hypothetical protein